MRHTVRFLHLGYFSGLEHSRPSLGHLVMDASTPPVLIMMQCIARDVCRP